MGCYGVLSNSNNNSSSNPFTLYSDICVLQSCHINEPPQPIIYPIPLAILFANALSSVIIYNLFIDVLSFFLSFISVHGFLFVRCLLDESMDIKFLFIRCIYLYFYSYPIVSFRLVLYLSLVMYSRSVFDMYLTFTTVRHVIIVACARERSVRA